MGVTALVRILICGGREWKDYRGIHTAIEVWKPYIIISGAARGADTIAEELAYSLDIDAEIYPAQWNTFGRAAGPIRNSQMLLEGKPDLVLAFHDDLENSKGTKNMVNQAKKAGLPVKHYKHGVMMSN